MLLVEITICYHSKIHSGYASYPNTNYTLERIPSDDNMHVLGAIRDEIPPLLQDGSDYVLQPLFFLHVDDVCDDDALFVPRVLILTSLNL